MDRVGAVLRNLGGSDALQLRLTHARVFEKWPEMVGPLLADRTRPLRVADGRLFVLAEGAALRQELTFHKRTILRKVNGTEAGHIARQIVFLEADALDYDGESRRVRWPDVKDPLRQEPGGESEPAAEETEEFVDSGAMYEAFDAEAYRRELENLSSRSTEG